MESEGGLKHTKSITMAPSKTQTNPHDDDDYNTNSKHDAFEQGQNMTTLNTCSTWRIWTCPKHDDIEHVLNMTHLNMSKTWRHWTRAKHDAFEHVQNMTSLSTCSTWRHWTRAQHDVIEHVLNITSFSTCSTITRSARTTVSSTIESVQEKSMSFWKNETKRETRY